jgi:hypothetical protein
MSWHEFYRSVRELPPVRLDGVVDYLMSKECGGDSVFVTNMERRIAAARIEGDLPEEVVLIALLIHALRGYVLRLHTDSALELPAGVWHASCSLHDTNKSIRDGALRISPNFARWGGEQDILDEAINRPLLVHQEDVDRLLLRRRPTEAEIRRGSQAIIARFQQAHPSTKMIKDDFIRQLRERHPRCTKEDAKKAWTEHAPFEWRIAGRPRKKTTVR